MIGNKMFLAVVLVFSVAIAGLLAGLSEQRGMIMNPSSGPRMAAFDSSGSTSFIPSVFAEEVTDNTLFVSGSSTASDNPDQVTVSFSVFTDDDSARISQQENAVTTAAVRNALVAVGIDAEDIETTGYSLSQQREYDPDTRKYEEKGYRTTHSMQVEVSDTGLAGDIIDAAAQAGANRIDGVYFGLSDSKMQELRLSALEAASENARERADAIADGLGISVSRVMSVSEGYSYSPVSRVYAMDGMESGASAPQASTELTPGSVQVSATVNVVFEIA